MKIKTPTGHGTIVCASAPIGDGQTEEPTVELQEHPDLSSVPKRSTNVKRILIANDHEVTRHGIRALLAEEKDFEICGEAANGLEAISQALALQPDLIVLDLIMPQAGGLTVANHLRQTICPQRFLCSQLTLIRNRKNLQAAGCDGYVLKQDASQELVCAIREVLRGATYFHKTPAATSEA